MNVVRWKSGCRVATNGSSYLPQLHHSQLRALEQKMLNLSSSYTLPFLLPPLNDALG